MKCWICRSMNLSFKDGIMAKNQDTFASVGYHDNKHASGAFVSHENSKLHVACMELHQASVSNQQCIQTQLNTRANEKQQLNRKHFINIVRAVQFLCKQNIALCSHDEERGNFFPVDVIEQSIMSYRA